MDIVASSAKLHKVHDPMKVEMGLKLLPPWLRAMRPRSRKESWKTRASKIRKRFVSFWLKVTKTFRAWIRISSN